MKYILLILFAGLAGLGACRPLPQSAPTISPAAPTPTLEIFQPTETNLDTFTSGLNTDQQTSLADLHSATVYHLAYDLYDDLTGLNGQAHIEYTNQEQTTLDEIQFRLFPNILGGSLTIEHLRRDGSETAPSYGLARSLLKVPLEPPLQPGQSTEFDIEFTVGVPQELESNYGVLAATQGVLTLAHAYPHIPVYDEGGWNAEIPSEQGDLTFADAAFYLVQVRAPKDLALAASGVETARRIDGERQVVDFAAGPARDFFISASQDYQVLSKTVDGVTINSYAPASLQEGSQQTLEIAAQVMQVFAKRYGAYPYTELDIVATPTYALGIEYPGVAAITLDLYDLQTGKFGVETQTYLESTVVHEVGHQWFYNLVGSDQSDEPWLDESLTQYITWQYFRDVYGQSGADGFEQSLRGRWARVENQPIPIGLPVSAYQGREYAAIVYGRGAFFFEALEKQMGQQIFDSFMLDYTQTHAWDIATTQGLKMLAEEYCACDLTSLFDKWVYAQP